MLAVQQLVLGYGPAVDSGTADAAASRWAEDGSYDFQDGVLEGREAVLAMVLGAAHQGLIARGAAHVLTTPHIVVDGDRAVATCYSLLHRYDGKAWVVSRVSANRWELERSEHGWQVTERVNRLLDGSAQARALLEPPGTA